MQILNAAITNYLKRRIKNIQEFIHEPMKTQKEQWWHLVNTAQFTKYGIEHGFKDIKTITDFKNQVPIVNYECFLPYINRILKGEENVAWPFPIEWFAKSSGTTSEVSKFIPVSYEAINECHYKAGKDVLALYCHNNPNAQIFAGKGLIMGGSHQVSDYNNNAKYGDLSAVLLQNMPVVAKFVNAPKLAISLLDDWEEKLVQMVEATVPKNITNISGVPTWTLVLLNKILKETGAESIYEIWPNFELYIHGGVSFKPYKQQFKNIFTQEQTKFYQTYNASEGFFGIQQSNSATDMMLLLDHGIFYEFIPMNELDNDHPKTLTIDEVELNTNYAIVVSTNAGLWRYKVGDTIKFTNLSPFSIEVTGRTKQFINAFGEEVMVANTDSAIVKACAQCTAEVAEYTVAPIYMEGGGKGGHEWLIEFEVMPSCIKEFTKNLDEALQQVNSDYGAKRQKNIALQQPLIRVLQKGAFFKWMKHRGKLGGQNKVPRLSNNRNYVDSILKMPVLV